MNEGATGAMRDYLKAHPEAVLDSIRHCVLDNYTEGAVGKASDLTPAKKKKLTPAEVYRNARRSSLIFGRFIHNNEMAAATA